MTTTSAPALRFSQRREWASEQAIGFLMQQAVENRDCVSLAAGLVDPTTLPTEIVRETADEILADEAAARSALQYGTTPGSEPVRETLLHLLATQEGKSVEELGVGVDRLVVTTGSAQLLSIVAEMLFDPGDVCLVAAPTYFVFLGTLDGVGARAIPVETDEYGMRPDALEQTLQDLEAAGELERVKLVYLVSEFENPSGVSLAAERRPQVVELARRYSRSHRIHVLEDAAYRELRYDGEPLPSVWSHDTDHDTVILAQTFSKSFSPGLRVGFGVLPDDLVAPVIDRKGNEDFGSANFPQAVLQRAIESGRYAAHVDRLRASYRRKRDAMVAAAERHLDPLGVVRWRRPEGGLYLWIELPTHLQTGFESPLFQRASRVDGVMYVPGELCFAGDAATRRRHHARLSFGVQDESGIEEGVRRLASAIEHVLASATTGA